VRICSPSTHLKVATAETIKLRTNGPSIVLDSADSNLTPRTSGTPWSRDSFRGSIRRLRWKLLAQSCVVGMAAALALASTSWAQTPSRSDSAIRSEDPHVPPVSNEARLLQAYRNLPLTFEANLGQTDPRVRFLSRRGSYTLFLTANEAVIESVQNPPRATSPERSRFAMTWMDANLESKAEGIGNVLSEINYLIGNDPERWRTGVPSYSKVRYRDVYPGVDLVYYSERGQLEYDLVLSPGARADGIRLKLDDAGKLHLTPSGDLILKPGPGEILLHKPVAYQPSVSGRDLVGARYILRGHNRIGFEIGPHDRSRPLIIDPQLTYSSYLGGSANDYGGRIAVDASGNAYIVGWSASIDFPTVGSLQSNNAGTTNVVVSKLNPELPGTTSLIYSTYLGGSGSNVGRGIAVDALGEVYISGDTNAPNFPITSGAYQTSCKMQNGVCSTDAFAAKLSASGNALLYSTYIGGSGTEFGFVIAIDSAGHMFLGGNTDSSNFPVTSGAYQTTFGGGPATFGDAYVVELNPAGNGAADLLYGSYLGGSGSEATWGIAVDHLGSVYLAGSTASSNFPVTAGAYQSTFSGGSSSIGDAFIAKLNPSGLGQNDLVYSTYLGGSLDDRIEGIAVDASNLIYVTGYTQSSNFPVTAATAFQPTFGGGTCFGAPCADAFVAKLDPSASGSNSLLYSTFFGGNGIDLGHGIALDSAGLVYITGETTSANLPLVNPIQSQCASGCTPLPLTDVLIAKFDLSKSNAAGLLFSTYLGGADVDTGWSIAVDGTGGAYITGQVFSTNFPTQIPFQAACDNCSPFLGSSPSGDAFLAKICTTNCPGVNLSPPSLSFGSQIIGTASAPQNVVFSNPGSGDLTFAAVTITGGNPGDFAQTNNCPAILAPQASCTFRVTFTPAAAGSRSASLVITDNGTGSPQAVTLSGTGAVPAVGLSPATLSFGNQTVNTTSAAQGTTLTNNGPGALTITSIGITGTNAGDYAQTNTCPLSPATLAVAGTCTISVTFKPTASGSRTASVSITDNGTGSPQTVGLSGTGVASVPPPWPNGYTYQGTFTVAAGQVPSAQTNFPALISGTFSDFETTANGGKIVNSCTQTVGNNATAVPCDLIFTSDAAGTSLLKWEFESYNAATGAVTIWVNVPSLTNGTVIYAWYGNSSITTLQTVPTGAWGSSFLAVYHLKENPAGVAPR
jgi:hypothetical protein